MTGQRNSNWQADVRGLLREGYGVEDIAHIMSKRGTWTTAEEVRSEVAMLRDEGELERIFRLLRTT